MTYYLVSSKVTFKFTVEAIWWCFLCDTKIGEECICVSHPCSPPCYLFIQPHSERIPSSPKRVTLPLDFFWILSELSKRLPSLKLYTERGNRTMQQRPSHPPWLHQDDAHLESRCMAYERQLHESSLYFMDNCEIENMIILLLLPPLS